MKRRDVLRTATLGAFAAAARISGASAAASAPVVAPAAGQKPTAVLVINSGAASLSVIDLATHVERTRIPVLREPHHWALSPDRQDLLIGDSAGNEVLFLDPTSFAIKRRLTIADPYQLGFSPDGKYLVVNGIARNQVDVYDARTYALVKRFALRSMPSHLDFTPDSAFVFISLQGNGQVACIDLRAMTVKWEANVGRAPAGVMWLNGRLLVANMGSDDVSVMNPGNGAIEGHILGGKGCHQLFLSPDRKILYVNSRVDGTIKTFDAATFAPIRTYKVPGGPDDLVFAPDGRIWVTLRFTSTVGILDLGTGAIEHVAVGRSPHGIYIHGAVNSGGGY